MQFFCIIKKVSQYTSHLYRNTPPIRIAVLLVPLGSEEREILSVLLPFVSQCASHLYCNTPSICIAIRLPFEKILVDVVTGIETPLTSYRIGFGPPARNRKKIGKI